MSRAWSVYKRACAPVAPRVISPEEELIQTILAEAKGITGREDWGFRAIASIEDLVRQAVSGNRSRRIAQAEE